MLAPVLTRAERPERRSIASLVFLTGAFVFGWFLGLAVDLKLIQMTHAPRSMLMGGVGYVSVMLGPVMVGFLVARLAGSLVARGWGGAPLRMLAVGAAGLVVGLLVL
jgi:hypothetical protein